MNDIFKPRPEKKARRPSAPDFTPVVDRTSVHPGDMSLEVPQHFRGYLRMIHDDETADMVMNIMKDDLRHKIRLLGATTTVRWLELQEHKLKADARHFCRAPEQKAVFSFVKHTTTIVCSAVAGITGAFATLIGQQFLG